MDIVSYRDWIAEQDDEKLRQVFKRLCEDQNRHYETHEGPDYLTLERQLSVETELRRREIDPQKILEEVYHGEHDYPPGRARD